MNNYGHPNSEILHSCVHVNRKTMDEGVNFYFVKYNTYLVSHLQVCSPWNPLLDCWKNC